MSSDAQAALGFVYFVIFTAVPITLCVWFNRRFGPGIRQRRRDRQIETHMRLAYRDAEVMNHIARRIEDERRF